MKQKLARLISLSLFFALLCPYLTAAALPAADAFISEAVVEIADNYTDFGMLTSDLKKEFSGVRVAVRAETDYNADFTAESGVLRVVDGPDGYYAVMLESREAAEAFAEKIERKPGIIYADVEATVSVAQNTPNGDLTEYNSWGVTAIEADIYAEYLTSRGIDTNVIVAVVDTGVASHPFLNGKVVNGYDFADGDNNPSNDDDGHGTHVAGTVIDCAEGTDIKVMAVRALDGNGWGEDIDIANGVRYACDNGAKVINLSLSGEHTTDYLEDVISYVTKKGCTVVCAAGNENSDTIDACPGHIAEVINVGAVDEDLVRASFSNYGEELDIVAPGVDIKSTLNTGGFKTNSGTSMASPHIAACAAMLKAANPSADAARIDELLDSCALDLGDVGYDTKYGAGIPKLSRLIPADYSPTSIEVVSNERQNYYIGDTFYTKGLIIKANFADGLSYNVTDFTVDYDFSQAGTVPVFIEYTKDGVTVSEAVEVTVKTPEITLSQKSVELYVGTCSYVTVTTKPNSSQVTVTPAILGCTEQSISNNIIKICGVTEGINSIEAAFTYKGIKYSDSLSVTVKAMPTIKSIEILTLPAKLEYYIGDTLNTAGLAVRAELFSGEFVSAGGYTVSAVDMNTPGRKSVTVTFGEGSEAVTAEFSVSVYTPSVTLTADSLTPKVGDTVRLTAVCAPSNGGTLVFRNTSAVNEFFGLTGEDGIYTAEALKKGDAQLVAVFTYNGIEYTDALTFAIAERPIKIINLSSNPSASSFSYGNTAAMAFEVNSNEIEYTVSWKSSNTSAFTVDSNGIITAVGNGSSSITATVTDENGNTDSMSITVTCKMSFWQRIVLFFRKLFGATMKINANFV